MFSHSSRKFQLLLFKGLVRSSPYKTEILPFNHLFNKNLNLFKIYPQYSFSSFRNFNLKDHKEELSLIKGYPQERLSETMEKYAECKDLNHLTHDEVALISFAFRNLALIYKSQKSYDKSINCLLEEENLNEKTINDSLNLAQNYLIRGSIYLEQKNWKDAEYYLNEVDKKCLLFSEDKGAKRMIAEAQYFLAELFYLNNQHDKALNLYNSVLDQASYLKEASKPHTLNTVFQRMAAIYEARNDINKAIDSWTRGFEGAVKYFGEHSKEAYFFSEQTAAFLSKLQQYSKAQKYAEKSLEIALKIFPKDGAEAAYNYCVLGHICIINQDFPKALNSLKKGCEVYEALPQYPSNLPPLHDSYMKMAQIYAFQGYSQEASNFFAKADRALVRKHGQEQLKLYNTYAEWAGSLQEHAFLKEQTKTYFRKALEILNRFGLKIKDPIWTFNTILGQMAFDEEDWSKACEHYKECEKCFPDMANKDTKTLQAVYAGIGTSLVHLNNLDEAEEYFQKFFQSSEATGDLTGIGHAYDYLGKIYEQKGMLKEALGGYKKAVEGLKAILKADHPRVQDVLKKVSEIEKNVSQ